MKNPLVQFATLTALVVGLPTAAQLESGPIPVVASSGTAARATEAQRAPDPRFDLNFAGGSPAALVAAIAEGSGKPINVIIPEEFADTKIPPMKLRQVAVPELFEALNQASIRRIERRVPTEVMTGTGIEVRNLTRSFESGYGFRANGKTSHESVWCFFRNDPGETGPVTSSPSPMKPAEDVERVRIADLSDILKAGRSVEDVTTAIRTGCELLPGVGQPRLKFHKETKLLFVSGRPDQLQIVDGVLQVVGKTPVDAPSVPFQMDPLLARRYGLTPPPPARLPPPEPPVEPAPKDSPRKP